MGASRERLLADLGNFRLKCATPDLSRQESFRWRDAEERHRLAAFLQANAGAGLLLASSSAEGLALLEAEVFPRFDVQQVTAEQVPLTIETRGTGVDRLLAAWMALETVEGGAVLADCGTAFTLDVVDRERRFLGGAIGAGLALQERALQEACPHLDAPASPAPSGLPKDTAGAVAVGTSRAFAQALDGLARAFLDGLDGPWTLLLTGGDASRLKGHLPHWRQEPNLVLRALQRLQQDSLA